MDMQPIFEALQAYGPWGGILALLGGLGWRALKLLQDMKDEMGKHICDRLDGIQDAAERSANAAVSTLAETKTQTGLIREGNKRVEDVWKRVNV